jgi:diguanylate cyclase (GGDEF)-like protein
VEQNKQIPESQSLQAEITRIVFTQLPINTLAVLINAIIIVIILWKSIPKMTLFIWIGVNLFVSLLRMSSYYMYRNKSSGIDEKRWLNLFLIGTFLGGVAFGSAGVFLFHPELFKYQVFVYFVLGGMVAGSSGTYAIKRGAFFLYSIPVFIPATIHFFIKGGDVGVAMGLMGFLFYSIMIVTVLRMNKVTITALTLSYENKSLVASLREEKQQTEKLNDELREMSLKDPMTGLQNRRFFLEIIKPEAVNFTTQLRFAKENSNKRKESPHIIYGIFLVDIDHFKRVNDTYGHDSGDMVLKQFSNILTDAVRTDDLVVRWGGEEFLVILRKTEYEFLFTFSERIRKTVQETPFKLSTGKTINKTCSVGFVPYPFVDGKPSIMDVEQTINVADRALYYAKNRGRNKSVGVFPCIEKPLDDSRIKKILDTFEQAVTDNDILLKTWG